MKSKKKYLLGFTLLELMVVMSILGFLISIVVPNYRTNVLKAQVQQGIIEAQSFKAKLTEAIINNGGNVPNITFASGDFPVLPPSISSITYAYVSNNTGNIKITFSAGTNNQFSELLNGKLILQVQAPSSSNTLKWFCNLDPANTNTNFYKYLPSACSDTLSST